MHMLVLFNFSLDGHCPPIRHCHRFVSINICFRVQNVSRSQFSVNSVTLWALH